MVVKFDSLGREIPDPVPMEVPAGYAKPESLTDMMRRMIRQDMSSFAEQHGAETFDEANDFEMGDDDAELSATHHELHEEVVGEVQRFNKEQAEAEAKARDSNGRRGHGETQDEGGDDGHETPPARSPSGTRVSRSDRKIRERSPQRRSTGRREEADTSEVDPED